MKVKSYVLSYCPYCHAAENLLKSKGIEFEEIICDDNKEEIKEKNNYETFPQIFIDDKLIGGYSELVKYLNEN